MTQRVLIAGSSGRFGRNAAQHFAECGWQVHRFDRSRDTLLHAVQGVDVVIAASNPPYTDWARDVPALHADIIEAAQSVDATVILPGNVYVFGPTVPSPWGVHSPHRADNPLGQIRRRMEEAYRNSGLRVIVLRAGDFIDTEPSGNWFDKVLTPGLPKGRFIYPGRTDIDHAWAYLPDLVRAAEMLATRRHDLSGFVDVPFAGYTLSGEAMRAALAEVTGRPIHLRRFAWWMLRLARPFWPMARPLLEMRYLWNTPHRLDDATLRRLLPDFEPTSLSDALSAAIAHHGAAVHRSTQTNR